MPRPNRKAQLLERVHQAIGANKIEQRWVSPVAATRHKGEQSFVGLASGSTIVVSPLTLVSVLIHEALHRAYPEWDEPTIEKHTTYLWQRMTDDECRRLYDAYAQKVSYIDKPISSLDE
jgi:hypothetical protein